MSDVLPSTLLDITLRNLRDHLQRLEADRAEIDRRISEVRTNIRSLEQQSRNGEAPPAAAPAGRRKKGENQRLIRELFEQDADTAFSVQEIAARTGVHLSSVLAVLNREDGGFRKNLDGKWQLAELPESAPTTSE